MSLKYELSSGLKLARPSVDLFPGFLEFVEDMRANGHPLWAPYLPKEDEAPDHFIARLLKRETEPELPFVPETVFWAVYDENVVGQISLRHRLEGNLFKIGGHNGYEVSPKWRKKGFATEMLRQVLQTSKASEIGHVLLTCSPDNEASNKTIQRNGGVFDKKVIVDFVQEDRNHYWIDCRSPQAFFEAVRDAKKTASGSHTRIVDGKKFEWFVEDLWELAKDLPIIEVDPKSIIDLDRDGWFTQKKPTPRLILQHMQRILDADLKYPVILHPDGSIMDGAHRACKAIFLGQKNTRAVRFSSVPNPSRITVPNDTNTLGIVKSTSLSQSLHLKKIHHIAIICSNYERSKVFYTQILGLKIVAENFRSDRQSYKLALALSDGGQIELFSFPNPPARTSRPEAAGLRHLAFEVHDIAKSVQALKAFGIAVEPIRVDEYTGRQFTFFSDPDELPLELYEDLKDGTAR